MIVDETATTLRALLRQPGLDLRIIGPDAAGPGPEASVDLPLTDPLHSVDLDVDLDGVHPSDLLDPTPFLTPGLALLTTGTQFAGAADDPALYRDYVARLRERGIAALGFGTEVVREGVPPLLIAACAEHGMPLFEVPYRTPFLAVTRAHAEARAARAYAHRVWALDAQRALSLAALRPDGLDRIVGELAARLDTWVCLSDSSGAPRIVRASARAGGAGRSEVDDATLAAVTSEARALLRRGSRASVAVALPSPEGTSTVSLQTLGRPGRLRGVLAIAGDERSPEARGVITAVVALAGLALEQRDSLDTASAALRRGTLQSALAGDVAGASRIARAAWGSWPASPIVVAFTDVARSARGALAADLERLAETRPLFFGRLEDGTAIALSADDAEGRRLLATLADEHGTGVGLSEALPWERLGDGIAHARHARERGGEHPGIHSYTDLARRGRLGVARLARTEEARAAAEASLAPLVAHDERSGGELIATLRAWFEADCGNEQAAGRLGVHRHTVRTRLATAADVLGRDLGSFADRAEVWVALEITAS
ncbi:PucR family transcriptional regulator [uncultured Microbacterium sp.]|uniref:PucR family transcriptional regulator n=1 Tax=uncultured Microbacterium sp. TaxID=191216 RepID=UPI0025F6D3BE|nr:PucR family transcriptional regulator [uncultured Microbacterium sp.]